MQKQLPEVFCKTGGLLQYNTAIMLKMLISTLVLTMFKKHSLLDFFPQESTLGFPFFGQSPLVRLRTLDRLVCKFE